ncbi:Rv1733c family protein [Streptomyces parvulus]|uniref:Rv1733c family protein n=1 Tax=Streptomyces parvulus TaxID=146923 RepID=UPI0033B357C7
MRRNRTVRRSLWRWRRNPLRRREDVLEGWILLVVWLLVAVAAPVAGILGAQASAHSSAQRRADRHPVTAVLSSDASRDSLAGGTTGGRVDAAVRWTAPDGTRHSGKATVDENMKAGSQVTVWTDRQDRLTPAPPSATQAGVDAAFMGAASTFAVVTAAAAGYYGSKLVLDRRRRAAWEDEWREIGSQWGRAAS